MSSTRHIAVFGCKSTTKVLIECLLDIHEVKYLVTISPERAAHFQVADYTDLRDYAKEKGIEVVMAEKYSLKSENDLERVKAMDVSLAFMMGWQRLIPQDILNQIKIGAFGMHGSAVNLPLGRGRSPMNWSIIEGREMFYTNLFKYDAGADSGEILASYKFSINEQDTGETMHFKNTMAMKFLIRENLSKLLSGEFELTAQANLEPTYYPKRSPSDSLIDWKAEVHQIERLIRAVTKPFNGAYAFIEGVKIKIFRAQVFDHTDFGYSFHPVGQIVEIFPNGKFILKALGGLLLVHEYEFDGEVKCGDTLDHGNEIKKHFPTNPRGGFDLPE